ncbi:MAG: prepilin-type N-terminal cleavage/methylation domain-containing protein [Candidatus Pacebacteria bacterium]|nr:prepilin-type N-terminal cleavage/methylation domain-containing protein [Candidatus Paceibacterota bacterium]
MKKGFTLVELMVSLTIFSMVVVIAIGALISMFNLNKGALGIASVMNDLNFTVESMTREIRFGQSYECGSGGDCPGGDSEITVNFEGVETSYYLSGTSIYRDVLGQTPVAITGDEVEITELTFYVIGSDPDDEVHPYVVMFISGEVGEDDPTSFTLQTSVTQRVID